MIPAGAAAAGNINNAMRPFDEKIRSFALQGHIVPDHSMIKTPEQIAGIRESGLINIAVLDYVAENIREGMSTAEIDRLVESKTREMGRHSCAHWDIDRLSQSACTSVNSQVCHGIPSEEDILKNGDIVNVDVSTIYKGYFSDSSRMFIIGRDG